MGFDVGKVFGFLLLTQRAWVSPASFHGSARGRLPDRQSKGARVSSASLKRGETGLAGLRMISWTIPPPVHSRPNSSAHPSRGRRRERGSNVPWFLVGFKPTKGFWFSDDGGDVSEDIFVHYGTPAASYALAETAPRPVVLVRFRQLVTRPSGAEISDARWEPCDPH